MEFLAAPLTMAIVILVAVIVFVITIKSLIVIVPPNQAAVLTGRNRTSSDGQTVGYRSISGGRTLRVPIIETVQHMNLETIPIEVSVNNAFSKGNIPLSVEAIANVKIASEPEWSSTTRSSDFSGRPRAKCGSWPRTPSPATCAACSRRSPRGRQRGPARFRQGAGR